MIRRLSLIIKRCGVQIMRRKVIKYNTFGGRGVYEFTHFLDSVDIVLSSSFAAQVPYIIIFYTFLNIIFVSILMLTDKACYIINVSLL